MYFTLLYFNVLMKTHNNNSYYINNRPLNCASECETKVLFSAIFIFVSLLGVLVENYHLHLHLHHCLQFA